MSAPAEMTKTNGSGEATPTRVRSADGTEIAFWSTGAGPPLVLVHGTGAEHFSFRFAEPMLARRFTVHAVDRRGRGTSGDSKAQYAIEQEFADMAAVVDSLEEPAWLLGHSYGATVALGAAPLARNLRGLILYEPAPGIPATDPTIPARLEAMLARNAREELLTAFMTEVAGLAPEDLDRLRTSPLWASRIAAAHTIPREIEAEERYRPDPETFGSLSIPAMLLLGDESPDWARRGTDVARSLLPECRVTALEGQGHVALMTAPDMFASEVARFAGST